MFPILTMAGLIVAIAACGWLTYLGTQNWHIKEGKALAWWPAIATLILLMALLVAVLFSFPKDIYIHDTYFLRLSRRSS